MDLQQTQSHKKEKQNMGIFSKLFGKKDAVPKKEAVPEKEIVLEKTLPESDDLIVDIKEPVDQFGRTKLQQDAIAGELGGVTLQLSLGAKVDQIGRAHV